MDLIFIEAAFGCITLCGIASIPFNILFGSSYGAWGSLNIASSGVFILSGIAGMASAFIPIVGISYPFVPIIIGGGLFCFAVGLQMSSFLLPYLYFSFYGDIWRD